jgi:8-oxo-dGTP pyrophosphatase MutT (NUDIX family)
MFMTKHDLHEISVKIALYSHDGERVLVMKYPAAYGLPGGHLDAHEFPHEALTRELEEELGITLTDFRKVDFFTRGGKRDDSIILCFTAIAPETIVLAPPNPKKEIGIWLTQQEMRELEDISPEYKRVVEENWPAGV